MNWCPNHSLFKLITNSAKSIHFFNASLNSFYSSISSKKYFTVSTEARFYIKCELWMIYYVFMNCFWKFLFEYSNLFWIEIKKLRKFKQPSWKFGLKMKFFLFHKKHFYELLLNFYKLFAWTKNLNFYEYFSDYFKFIKKLFSVWKICIFFQCSLSSK